MTSLLCLLFVTASSHGADATLADTIRIQVEGKEWRAWKVEERRQADGHLLATWYLVEQSPYMVYGEVVLPDGRIQRMTEVEIASTAR